MGQLKDNLYSAGAAAAIITGCAAVGAVCGVVIGGVGLGAAAVASAGLGACAGALVGVTGAAAHANSSNKPETVSKTISGLGGVVLSLAAVFGTAGYAVNWSFDNPEISEHTGQKSEPVQKISSEQQYSDAAQAFNVANNDIAVRASMDAQGDCVLTVNPKAPALS